MKVFLATLLAWVAIHARAEAPTFRLGDAATPTAYDVAVAVDPREREFAGEVRIDVRVARATSILWLNAQDLEILEAHFTQGGRRLTAKVTLSPPYFAGFEIEGGFEAGDATTEIRYRGRFENVGTRGLFRQEADGRWYATTQFEAMNARRAFPCFDEPQWKTPWRLTIDAPAADSAFANTPAERVGFAPREGWRRHVFTQTKPLPTYLVAFGVGPFDVVPGGTVGTNATPLRYVVTSGRGHEAGYPRSATPALINYLEGYFGRPYPYEKLDSLTIPNSVGFGAMENAGLITYSSNIMLRMPGRESLAFKRTYASIAAHEIAHMWFGDMVTMKWWNDIWLNEGFATWMAGKAMAAVHPDWQDGWRGSVGRRRALNADRLMSARRVANPVEVMNDMSGAFDAITYQKGAAVLSMFEGWMGEERFRSGVRAYLHAHAHGSATSGDFLDAIGAASGKADIAAEAFRSFLDQPGAPLIETSLRCDGGPPRLELSQHRFIPKGSRGEEPRWMTPACFHYSVQGRLHKACTEVRESRTLPLETKACPSWVVGNAEGAGHWLARLDGATLQRLLPNLARIPEFDAVGLAVNTSLLLRTGLMPAAQALAVAERLLQHPSVAVKTSAIAMLDELHAAGLPQMARRTLAGIGAKRVMPLARSISWQPRTGESLSIQELRAELLPYAATLADGEPLRVEARKLVRAWLRARTSLDASVVTQVLSTAARFADESHHAELIAALTAPLDRRERTDLIEALSVARDPKAREHGYDLLKPGGALDGRDSLTFIRKGLGDKATGEALFAFVRTHWDDLLRKLPPDSGTTVMREMSKFCTRQSRDRFVEFFAPRAPELLGGPRAYQQTLESIEVCVAAGTVS